LTSVGFRPSRFVPLRVTTDSGTFVPSRATANVRIASNPDRSSEAGAASGTATVLPVAGSWRNVVNGRSQLVPSSHTPSCRLLVDIDSNDPSNGSLTDCSRLSLPRRRSAL